MATYRTRYKTGDVLKIELVDGTHSYAHVSTEPLVHFYDLRTDQEYLAAEVVQLPIAFSLWVFNSDLNSSGWTKIGNISLSEELLVQPLMFKQDIISGRLSLHHDAFEDTNFERPATRSECRGLERAAVWTVEHIESRLADHFEGVQNKWTQALAIDEKRVPDDQFDD